ncbi:MAG: hypothetical protein HYZ15_15130 [Sphingobacteriales bacterium]|nr:hypothetical protein [Sphingobacteriales bacterium]
MKKKLPPFLLFALLANICLAQNYSGLQNKTLTRVDDMGSFLESQIGNLFGNKLSGKIDSVIVTWDAEKTLKARVYYTGYINGYFTVSAIGSAKQKQNEVVAAKIRQSAAPSPYECTLQLAASVPKGTKLESSFLRIDVGKKENGVGNVSVFNLSKNWKNELDPQNVVVAVNLTPVGKAASLTEEIKDVIPTKIIQFDPKRVYIKPADTRRVEMLRTGGGNHIPAVDYRHLAWPDDISGTWINTDASTRGITKLIVTNNKTIQGFGKCSPQDCDWGNTPLTDMGNNNFRAVFEWSFATATLAINYNAGQLTVNETHVRKGGGTQNFTYTFKKNFTPVYIAANVYTLKQVAALPPASSGGQPASTVSAGPNKDAQFSLIDAFSADVDFKRPQDISNINLNAFLDKNPKSGVVYILPADYHLKWQPKAEPEKGYDFRILYGSQTGATTPETGSDAPVRMSATLTADISTREINFVKTLLKASLPDFTNVKFLPLRENPQFTFQNTLGAQYNIPQNKVSVETSTDLSNDIRVAWQTDADTKEFIQTALTSREGVAASVILKPGDEGILDQQIPAVINLADIRTLGKMNIEPTAWRGRNWRNETPYPLKLNYLHVLKKENTGKNPIIYSWSMNGITVPSQAQVSFNSSTVPGWLDRAESVVMWIDYSVMDCSDCDRKVMDAVTGGVSGTKSQQIKFTIPPAVFDTLHASYFLVAIRSKQVDPKGEELKELATVKITRETGENAAGPLFIPAGGAVDFEYRITVATTDGDFYPANDWIKGADKEILLGKTKMKEIFRGIIPGIN